MITLSRTPSASNLVGAWRKDVGGDEARPQKQLAYINIVSTIGSLTARPYVAC